MISLLITVFCVVGVFLIIGAALYAITLPFQFIFWIIDSAREYNRKH